MFHSKICVFLLIATLIPSVFSINCYTCSVGEKDAVQTCADNAEEGAVKKNCNKKYCTIIRQEFKDPKNRIASFVRGCEDKPLGLNNVVEDTTFRTYYTACQQDYCNGGSGKAADTGSKVGALGDKSNILAPGIGNNSWFVKASILLTVVFTMTVAYI